MNFDYLPEEVSEQNKFGLFCREELAGAASKLDRAEVDEARKIMRDNISKLAAQSYVGMNLPAKLGGGDKSLLASLPFHIEVAKACPSTFVAVESSAGMVGGLLSKLGVKDALVEDIISGRSSASFAATEPQVDLDVTDIAAAAKKEDDEWVLNGILPMVVNAPDADFIVTPAVINKEAGPKGLGLFLIAKKTKGVSFGDAIDKLGLRGASMGDIHLDDCRLSDDCLLGSADQGLALFEEALTGGRIRLAALSIGICAACVDLSLKFSTQKRETAKPMFRNQEISFKISDMQTMMDTSLQMTRYAAWLYDRNDPKAKLLASCAKLFASESAGKVANMALQIFGGLGYQKGNEVERLIRDARFCELGKGSSEIQRSSIAKDVFDSFA